MVGVEVLVNMSFGGGSGPINFSVGVGVEVGTAHNAGGEQGVEVDAGEGNGVRNGAINGAIFVKSKVGAEVFVGEG